MDGDHVHVISKTSIRLYKNSDYVGCEVCGKSMTDIIAGYQAEKDCQDYRDHL